MSDAQTVQAVQPVDVLVIGAGLAGLACAYDLEQAGRQVLVLDKSRGISGRSSTRHVNVNGLSEPSEVRLDHGARSFTARNLRTQAWVQSGLEAGWLGEWTRHLAHWENGKIGFSTDGEGHPRYAPLLGMNQLGQYLGGEGSTVQIETNACVVKLSRMAGKWQAECQDGRCFSAAQVMLNIPAPQIMLLLAEVDLDTSVLAAVKFEPCWAVGAVLEQPLKVDWPALQFSSHPVLAWLSREDTKRAISAAPTIMLHANATWSTQQLHSDKADVIEALISAAGEVVGPLSISQTFAHRWLYATPTTLFAEPSGWWSELGLGWCGDWCTSDEHGPRVEAALLSGWKLAERGAVLP